MQERHVPQLASCIQRGADHVCHNPGACSSLITRVWNLTMHIFNFKLKIKIFVLIYKIKFNLIYIFNFNDNYF